MFQLGVSADEAMNRAQIVQNAPGPPGDIVRRLGQQFQLPRSQPDANMSDRPGMNTGES